MRSAAGEAHYGDSYYPGIADGPLEELESGSPSKSRRKGLGRSQRQEKGSSRCSKYALLFAVLVLSITIGAVLTVFLIYGLKALTEQQDNRTDGIDGSDALQSFLRSYNYSSCPLHWALESSGYNGDTRNDHEALCLDLEDPDVCASTINCCWIEELTRCATHEAKPECSMHISRHTCAEDPFCMWQPAYGCRRGFQRTLGSICSKTWLPSALEPTRECRSFGSEDICSIQLGCCWAENTCTTFDKLPECSTFVSQESCIQRSQFCIWVDSECQRGERFKMPLVSTRKSNIVLVVADDLGFGDVGFNGGIARTPNLDTLFRSPYTIAFTNMHGSPVCSPSRASLLGGQYPDTNCVSGARIDVSFNMHPGMTTIADDARAAGYRTAMFGKWHLGRLEDNGIGVRGFDNWTASFGNIITFDTPCFCNEVSCKRLADSCPTSIGCKRLDGQYCTAPSTSDCVLGHNSRSNFIRNPPNSFDCDLSRLGSDGLTPVAAGMPRKMMYSDFLASQFREFVQSVPVDTPLLAYIAFSEPHTVYVADPQRRVESEAFHKLPANSRAANYIAVIEAIDGAFGSIKQTLEEVDRLDNTLLVFTSDNGPEPYKQGGSGSARPFRGWKRTLYEGGVRVPSFLHFPQYVKGNVRVSGFTGLLDIRPTLRDVLLHQNPTAPLSAERFDGESLFPLINGVGSSWQRSNPYLICFPMFEESEKKCATFAYYEDEWKLILQRGNELGTGAEFYNIRTDPGESKNLATSSRTQFLELANKAKQAVGDIMDRHNARCANAYSKK